MIASANKCDRSAKPVMLVVVHDFSPVFITELKYITEKLAPILGLQMSAAIVPRWWGSDPSTSSSSYRDLILQFSEHLLHGWTHQSAGRWRPLSLMTRSSDEFWGLDEAVILARIELAQRDFRELTGENAKGFLAPAWQLPIQASRLSSLQFVMRFRSLESCRVDGRIRLLATSSWDWGRLGWLGHGGEWMGTVMRRISRTAIPCIAIHPIDVRRGYFDRALRLIETLVEKGYQPGTASTLMSAVETAQ